MNAIRHCSLIERTAVHEAGHAVMCAAVGRAIRYVTIVPERGADGSCWLPGVPAALEGLRYTSAVVAWAKDEIRIALAGAAAERRFCGQGEPSGPDLALLHDAARRAWNFNRDLAVDRLRGEVRGFFCDAANWRDVVAVADALLERRTLTGSDVARLLRG